MNIFKGILAGIGLLIAMLAIAFLFGWSDVLYTKTVGKAKQDASRVVYEETNSFTKAKRQEIIKYYKEWQDTDDPEERKAIESILVMSLADFDEDRFISELTLRKWVKNIKYNIKQ